MNKRKLKEIEPSQQHTHEHEHDGDCCHHSDQEPYRAAHKVGRNDLCPCGSGSKYKKCCLLGKVDK